MEVNKKFYLIRTILKATVKINASKKSTYLDQTVEKNEKHVTEKCIQNCIFAK